MTERGAGLCPLGLDSRAPTYPLMACLTSAVTHSNMCKNYTKRWAYAPWHPQPLRHIQIPSRSKSRWITASLLSGKHNSTCCSSR